MDGCGFVPLSSLVRKLERRMHTNAEEVVRIGLDDDKAGAAVDCCCTSWLPSRPVVLMAWLQHAAPAPNCNCVQGRYQLADVGDGELRVRAVQGHSGAAPVRVSAYQPPASCRASVDPPAR